VSLANARKHWRFLAAVMAILLVLAAVPPVLIYGVGPLLGALADSFGNEAILAFGVIFAAGSLGWLFFVLWAGDKADRAALGEIDR
jgi:hypothetical protein